MSSDMKYNVICVDDLVTNAFTLSPWQTCSIKTLSSSLGSIQFIIKLGRHRTATTLSPDHHRTTAGLAVDRQLVLWLYDFGLLVVPVYSAAVRLITRGRRLAESRVALP